MDCKKEIIKKLNTIFSNGYVAKRGEESYCEMLNGNLHPYRLCNCFEHACLNLTNQQIAENFEEDDAIYLQGLSNPLGMYTPRFATYEFKNYLEQVGLKMKKCSKDAILKNNQWKVAIYYDEITFGGNKYFRGFHFMRQEEDGKWSGKYGYEKKVDILEELPEQYDNYYKLYNTYSITNPNAREK